MSEYSDPFSVQSSRTQDELYRSRAQSMMTALRYAWISEKSSPELLPYQSKVVEVVQREIDAMQARLDNDEVFRPLVTVLQIEIDRSRFVLAAYARTRLEKIQKYVLYITSEQKALQRLSPAELKFARSLRTLFENHMNASVLNSIPEVHRRLDARGTVPEPKLTECVIVRNKADLGDVTVGNETVSLSKGAIIAARYNDILPWLSRNQAELI